MREQFEKLEELGKYIAKVDENVIEVFIHQDQPRPPLESEEIYIVCYLNSYDLTNDIKVYDDEAVLWSIDLQDKIADKINALGLSGKEIIISPFNLDLHKNNEYGEYFRTLYIREGYEPILDLADREMKSREQIFEEVLNENQDVLLSENENAFAGIETEEDESQELNVFQAADLLGKKIRTIQKYLKNGLISGYKKNNTWIIPKEEVFKLKEASNNDVKEYNVDQVARLLGKNKRSIQRYLKEEKLKGYKKNNAWFVLESEIEKFLK